LILVCPESIVWLEGLVRRSEIVILLDPPELETSVSVVWTVPRDRITEVVFVDCDCAYANLCVGVSERAGCLV